MIDNIHVSYCELPAETRALLTIYGLAAATRFAAKPPRKAALAATLNMVWDAERLTLADLADPDRVTELIEQYMAPARSCVGPALPWSG